MALINVIAFVVSSTLHNLVFMRKFLFANLTQATADTSSISKNIQRNIVIIFNAIPEALFDFV